MWIIGGDVNQGHYHDDVWSSADGQTWTRENAGKPVPWGPRALHHTVVFRDKIWVMGGQTVPQLAPAPEAIHRDIWNSADGVAWTRRGAGGAALGARGMIGGAAVFQGRMWILGGGTYDTPQTPVRKFYNDVWSSADGVHWTRHLEHAPWAARQYHEVAVFDDRLWVLEGYSGQNRNDVWHSADGVRWHQVPDTPWAPRHAASVFVHDHALWVVAGNNMEPDVWKLVRSGKAAVDPEKAPRESREIATGWRFQIDTHDLGEKDRWFDPRLDRSAWARVEVPRAWDTFDESLRGFEGIGWYAVDDRRVVGP